MVDSTLPPEDPQTSAAPTQPGPEAASPPATESTGLQQGEAPAPSPAAPPPAPATPEPMPASEAPASETVLAGAISVTAPGESAAPMPPASPTSTAPINGDPASTLPVSGGSSPEDGNTVVAAVSSAPPQPLPSAAAASEPPTASPPEGVASTLSVPPLDERASAEGEGGEFDLLINRVSAWLKQQDLPARWEKLQGPLRGLALLLLALVLLRLYGALIDTLDSLPLVPRLFQLVGVIVLVRFSLTNLVRTSDRERLISSWQQRWATFRGRV
ncbi:MAG: CAAD domain-containing protein [Synechococcaceae cyanobacterium]